MKLPRAALLGLLALTQVALGAPAGSNVLCIEPGGRVRIEPVGALCCSECEDDCLPDSDEPTVSSGCCCPCVDIPLPGNLDRAQPGGARHETSPSLVACSLALEPCEWDFSPTVPGENVGASYRSIGPPSSSLPLILRC
ncbi:hypothetical protein HY251_13975 [bacterium]|nr:hypothetical protein [bacterium]